MDRHIQNLTRGQCKDGVVVPAVITSAPNALLYLLALMYCFLGIAIIADVFMCSIERITSTTRKVRCKNLRINRLITNENTPANEFINVRVWNPTVANLTLMALGSSAPEILLSIIEIITNNFRVGDLGPGTIVGSAAFNLLCITAVCIFCVSSPKTKRIEEIQVFAVTSLFSCFAYIWLLIILVVISPNVVELWEALMTLAFFLMLIVIAYATDKKICKPRRTWLRGLQMDKSNHQKFQEPIDDADNYLKKLSSEMACKNHEVKFLFTPMDMLADNRTLRQMSQYISQTYPNLSSDEQSKLLASKLTQLQFSASTIIEFSARVYSIKRGSSKVKLKVIRSGPIDIPLIFRYSTKNGVAKSGLHFLSKSETMQFTTNEKMKDIFVDLVENANWQPGDVFYVLLKLVEDNDDKKEKNVKIGQTYIASVRFPDDSASFVGEPMIANENQKYVRAFITRIGHHNEQTFSVYYETESVTAKCNEDYEGISDGILTFSENEYEKYIDVNIYDDLLEEKDETFNINLISATGVVTIGPNKRTVITIVCDDNMLRNIRNLRKLTSHYMLKMRHETNSWLEQIIESISVNAGDLSNATLADCLIHILVFPWKVLAALIPPASFMAGWSAFICALILIGLITAIVGDLASIFGCMVGLHDAVTAITLVALGTSLPDTFASKIAAQNDISADNAIGNITGSNAVNVFLGLGLPWTIAAMYWFMQNKVFIVDAGNLSFSVAIFLATSALCLVLLITRRHLTFFGKGELGGRIYPKTLSALILIILWLAYIFLSILQTLNYLSI
ncbi:unnamed protein product [Thelazia callipaeda]|uniref:Sodium/calcium exchanger 3 n=1 Tax=Thelazia callipaeda TaxID=103827 RepID=A0A158RB13_THECL|nr:unnamed protein product [Thelazia callipaeda]